jgi:arylsulfatase A-like enzyme
MKFPKSRPAAGRVEALTETVDIMATLLDLLGIAAPPGTVQGASLVPLLTGARDKVHDYTFSRTNGEWPCYVVRNREWALLLYQGGRMRALYDLSADPRQTHNVINEHPEEANALAKAFAQFAETQPFRPLDFLDPSFKPVTSSGGLNMAIPEEARRKLRSLGYLE